MECFTILLAFTKLICVGFLVSVLVWLSSFRGGFGWQSNPKLQFNWHPILMSLGMIVLYGHAILVYRVLRNTKKYTAKLIHSGLNILGFIFTVIGLKAVFDSHNLNPTPIPNMYSLHSWIGLAAVILFACQWAAGMITFLFPGLNPPIRAFYLPIHVFFGLFGFVLANVAALLGFLEKAIFSVSDYSNFGSEGVLINCMGVALLIYSSMVVYLMSEPKFKRMQSTEDQTLLTAKELEGRSQPQGVQGQ